jgi:hypothetical protein
VKFDIGHLQKYVEKIEIWLKLGKNIGCFTWPKYLLLLLVTYCYKRALWLNWYQAVRQHVLAQLPLCRFMWNLIVGIFMNVCRVVPNLDKMGQKNVGHCMRRPNNVLFQSTTLDPYKRTLQCIGLGLC